MPPPLRTKRRLARGLCFPSLYSLHTQREREKYSTHCRQLQSVLHYLCIHYTNSPSTFFTLPHHTHTHTHTRTHTHTKPPSLCSQSPYIIFTPFPFSLSTLSPITPKYLSPPSPLTGRRVWLAPGEQPLHCRWSPRQLREREQHQTHHSGLPRQPWVTSVGLPVQPAFPKQTHTQVHACTHAQVRRHTHVHTHIHTQVRRHTHVHTHIHTQVRRHTHVHTHTHTSAQTHTCTHTHTHTSAQTHTCTHTYTHKCADTHMYTHIHTQVRRHTHAHTHTYTHKCVHTHTLNNWLHISNYKPYH